MNDFLIKDGVLVEYTGTDEVVIVPETVREIKFSNDKDLSCAQQKNFQNAKNMKKLVITKNVTKLDYRLLCGNKGIKEIVIESDQIDEYGIGHTFQWCSSLERVDFGNCNTYIPSCCFDDCKSLEQIVIPKNIDYIGKSAFSGCVSLKKIVIENENIRLGESIYGFSIPDNHVIEFSGTKDQFMNIIKQGTRTEIRERSVGDWQHRDVMTYTEIFNINPFGSPVRGKELSVICKADGAKIIYRFGPFGKISTEVL